MSSQNLICYSMGNMKDMASAELGELSIQCVVHHYKDHSPRPQFIAFDSFSSYHFEMESGPITEIQRFPCNTDEHLSKYPRNNRFRILNDQISHKMHNKFNKEGGKYDYEDHIKEYAYPFLKHLNSQFLIQKLQVEQDDVSVD